MSDKNVTVELADVIEGLRQEIKKAQDNAKDKTIRFGINHIDVELDVTIMKGHKLGVEAGAEADSGDSLLKYFVGKVKGNVKTSGEYEYQKVAKQKVTVNLSVEDSKGKKVSVSKTQKKKRS